MRQRYVEAARQRLMTLIESKRGSRVILLVHREETMRLLGFPLMRYIDLHDWEEVVRAIDLTDPQVPIDLILHTPGGLALASLQIARAIKQYPGRVTVFVPHYAMSGGTLIAISASNIVMSKHAVLGPVDPQLGQYPAVSLLEVVARKPIEHVDDETLILADQARKAIDQMERSVKELLKDTYPPEKADELAKLLSRGSWTHDHPITCEEAKGLGLRVGCDLPQEVLQLMDLFPQPVRRQTGVEYLPIRRSLEPGPPKA